MADAARTDIFGGVLVLDDFQHAQLRRNEARTTQTLAYDELQRKLDRARDASEEAAMHGNKLKQLSIAAIETLFLMRRQATSRRSWPDCACRMLM